MSIPDPYPPQPGVDDARVWEAPPFPEQAELGELSVVVPLASAAESRVGERVTLLFVGSDLQTGLEGKLTAVNDDATITLDDGQHRFDIALQAIAAIQGSRS